MLTYGKWLGAFPGAAETARALAPLFTVLENMHISWYFLSIDTMVPIYTMQCDVNDPS